jgi:hypothetical protein
MGLNIAAVVVSFCVGIALMLCIVPEPTVVIKFPTPQSEDYVYRAEDGTCFRIKARNVDCNRGGEDGGAVRVLPQPIHDHDPAGGGRWKFQSPFS